MIVCFEIHTGNGCRTINHHNARFCRTCGMPLRLALRLHDTATEIGNYRIMRLIGYGGYGAVYAAEMIHQPGSEIALKETFNSHDIRSFESEFAILSNLQHPNLPGYYDMFEHAGHGYLVMEMVPGQSLMEVQKKQRRPLLESQVLGFALQLCDGLSYLHSQNPPVIHRDIKPDNVRLTPEGLIKLVDFGLLKQGLDTTQASRRGLTPCYAAVEQWGSSNQHTDQRSDIYSLGATLYHLLTGQRPLAATERLSSSPDPLVPPRRYNSSLSQHVADALLKAMQLTPDERYVNAREFKRALMNIESVTPITSVRATLSGHTAGVIHVVWSPDGATLATTGRDKTIRLWDVQQCQQARMIQGHTDTVNCLAWSPDGHILVSGSNDKTICMWDITTQSLQHILAGHAGTAGVTSVAYSPDGTSFASVGSDRIIRLWDVQDGKLLSTLEGIKGSVGGLAYSPDGHYIASQVIRNGTVWLWQVSDGKLLRMFREKMSRNMVFAVLETEYVVGSVAYCPDGQTIASGGSLDSTVRLWNVADGVLVGMLEGHTGSITSVAYSPDGQTLASAGNDGTIRLWSVADARLIDTLEGHTDVVTCVAYSPDGQTLASTSLDRTVRLWHV